MTYPSYKTYLPLTKYRDPPEIAVDRLRPSILPVPYNKKKYKTIRIKFEI